jgi:hypothetical protein
MSTTSQLHTTNIQLHTSKVRDMLSITLLDIQTYAMFACDAFSHGIAPFQNIKKRPTVVTRASATDYYEAGFPGYHLRS